MTVLLGKSSNKRDGLGITFHHYRPYYHRHFEFIMPILHYVLGLRFDRVCEQKREQNASKTQNIRLD